MGKAIIHENGFVCYVVSFTALGSKTSNIVRNSPLEVEDKGQHCLFTWWENKSLSSKRYQHIPNLEAILSVYLLLFLPNFSHPCKKHLLSSALFGWLPAWHSPCSWGTGPPSCSHSITCTWEEAAHGVPKTGTANISAACQVPVTPEPSSTPGNTMPSTTDQRLIPCDECHLRMQSAGQATSPRWGGNGCSTLRFRCSRLPVFPPDTLRPRSVLGRRGRRYNLTVPDLAALNCWLPLSCVAHLPCGMPQHPNIRCGNVVRLPWTLLVY